MSIHAHGTVAVIVSVMLGGCWETPVPSSDAGAVDASAPFDSGTTTGAGDADAGHSDAGVDAGPPIVFIHVFEPAPSSGLAPGDKTLIWDEGLWE